MAKKWRRGGRAVEQVVATPPELTVTLGEQVGPNSTGSWTWDGEEPAEWMIEANGNGYGWYFVTYRDPFSREELFDVSGYYGGTFQFRVTGLNWLSEPVTPTVESNVLNVVEPE